MKVSWPRPVSTQLRMPQVCAATGGTATQLMPMLFRNRSSYWLPGIGRLIMNLTNPFIAVPVPLSDAVKQKVIICRLISLGAVLGGLVLGLLLAVVVGDAAGGGLFFLLLVVGVVGSVIARLRADVVGTDVNGDVISMRAAHPRFVQALLATNPPGMLSVEPGPGEAAPWQQVRGQAPLPSPTQYPPAAHPQPGYPQSQDPQAQYSQQPGYSDPGQPTAQDHRPAHGWPSGPAAR